MNTYKGLIGLCWVPCVVGLIALGVLAIPVSAQTRTWDGNGTPDSSGNWSTAANWDGPDNIPDTSSENASLPNVTAGTRTVTVDASYTIGQLMMTQTTASAASKLVLSAPLTLLSTAATATPFKFNASAGLGNLILDLNGQTLNVTNSQSAIITLDGTVNMGAGSVLSLDFGNGASDQKGMIVTNRGNLYQNGSLILYRWNASTGNNDGSGLGRSYVNTRVTP